MKINRFLALAVIALLVIGSMGAISLKGYAQVAHPTTSQTQGTEGQVVSADNDNIEEQVGEQVEDGQPDSAEATGSTAESSEISVLPQGESSVPSAATIRNASFSTSQVGPASAQSSMLAQSAQTEGSGTAGTDSGPDEQYPSYSSSIAVDQSSTDGMSEADEASALASMATITVDQSKAAALAANPGTTVIKAELDNENGALVYSVELSNGADVKVDAGNGTILFTDSGADNEQ
jgi:uncharacterized membrane protein YkoI